MLAHECSVVFLRRGKLTLASGALVLLPQTAFRRPGRRSAAFPFPNQTETAVL